MKKGFIVLMAAVMVLSLCVGCGETDINWGDEAEESEVEAVDLSEDLSISESDPEVEKAKEAYKEKLLSEARKDADTSSKNIGRGEQLSLIENEINGKSVCVLKYRIKPSYNNRATINQNYFTVEEFILNGGDGYDEIQYWAVAEMASGEESKVISFTLSKEMIGSVSEKKIPANKFGEYVDDLWVLPSLLQ